MNIWLRSAIDLDVILYSGLNAMAQTLVHWSVGVCSV